MSLAPEPRGVWHRSREQRQRRGPAQPGDAWRLQVQSFTLVVRHSDAEEDTIMLTSSVLEGTQIVAATYSGSLRTEEMTTLREQIEGVIDAHGQARLLLEYGDIDLSRIEPRAMWEDLKTAGVLGDVDRIAVLTDARWLQTVTSAAQAVTPAQVQVYDVGQRSEAERWLRGQQHVGD